MLSGATTVRTLEPGDRAGLIAAAEDVFGAGALSPAAWRWSYERSPHGTRAVVLVDDDGVLGSFAARRAPAWRGTERVWLGLAIDLFVHPRARRGLGAGAGFERLCAAFFARHGGRDFDALFGWPADAALRFGRRRLGFEPLEDEVVHVVGVSGDRASGPRAVEVARCVDGLGALWQRCRPRDRLTLERDERWARWRFDQHPRHRYRRFALFADDGAPRGFAVARGGEELPEGVWAVAEWMVVPGDREAAAGLLAALRREAFEDGARELVFAWPVGSTWARWGAEMGWTRRRTGRVLAWRGFGVSGGGFEWRPGDGDWV